MGIKPRLPNREANALTTNWQLKHWLVY